MNNVVTIKTANNRESEMVIHPEKAATVNLGIKKFAYLSFGCLKQNIRIRMDPTLPPDAVILSQNLIERLHLPDYPVYEIVIHQNAIVIGPHLGLLVSREDRRLTPSKLTKLTICLKEYKTLHGSVIVFALDKVDRKNLLIEGYCYNPNRNDWQWGVFPYPAAIFRSIGLSPDWKNHFLTEIGDTLFNNRFFGKWEMVQWFSREPGIDAHIPHTVLYHTPQDILDMLDKFPEIYIKPVLGLQGRGIVRMSVANRVFILKSRENGVNNVMTFADPTEAEVYLQKRFREGRYVIQQAIDLLQYKGSLIDFRCVLQKNKANAWQCPAVIGRVGVKDSIVSNISSGGAAFLAETILRRALDVPQERIPELKKDIAAFAITVADKLNEYGINCGTLGLDIGVDHQGFLWLIEINNRDPDPGIALDIRDSRLYYTLKAGPLFYAKYLAGFGDRNPSEHNTP